MSKIFTVAIALLIVSVQTSFAQTSDSQNIVSKLQRLSEVNKSLHLSFDTKLNGRKAERNSYEVHFGPSCWSVVQSNSATTWITTCDGASTFSIQKKSDAADFRGYNTVQITGKSDVKVGFLQDLLGMQTPLKMSLAELVAKNEEKVKVTDNDSGEFEVRISDLELGQYKFDLLMKIGKDELSYPRIIEFTEPAGRIKGWRWHWEVDQFMKLEDGTNGTSFAFPSVAHRDTSGELFRVKIKQCKIIALKPEQCFPDIPDGVVVSILKGDENLVAQKGFSSDVDTRLADLAKISGAQPPTRCKLADEPAPMLNGDASAEMNTAVMLKKRCLLVFGFSKCLPCKQMEKYLFSTEEFKSAAKDTICIKVDRDRHSDLVDKFGIDSYPSYVLLSDSGEEIRRENGLLPINLMTEFLR